MSIVVKEIYESDEEDYEWNSLEITENDKTIFEVADSVHSPEDNNLDRDFSDCRNVYDLLKKFYEYGKQGIEVDFN